MTDDHWTRRRRRIEIAMAHARIGSQKEMADKLGVSQPTLHEVMSGKRPGAGLIAKICNETGVDAEWIQFGFIRSAPVFALPYYIDEGLGDLVDAPMTPRTILGSDNAECRLFRDVSEGRIHPSFTAHAPPPSTTPSAASQEERIAALERENAELKRRLSAIIRVADPVAEDNLAATHTAERAPTRPDDESPPAPPRPRRPYQIPMPNTDVQSSADSPHETPARK